MGLNTEFLGRVFPATEPYEVGREKIREFVRATGGTPPAENLVAPPTFAVLLTMNAEFRVMFDPGLGLDAGRLLHRDQRFEHHRPIVPGDRLTVTVRVAGVDDVGGNDVLTLSSRVSTVDDEPVCTGTSVIVCPRAAQ
ncbi:MaoC family dehydratase N-terminal domain-containing protein [Kutzneria sp. NPDC052558]|uniref:FAS1-like dehydratase domain-containing protein n=1 Tax=Kutzneria sp. NPDC052558 TaxID=3364121 RepID=UPI0037C89D9F